MSSKYPILDDKPIDQWKVTELKEELKKRKLAVKGLKDDLIKRLDEAIRIERENEGKDVITGDVLEDNQSEDEAKSVDDQSEDEEKLVDDQPEDEEKLVDAQPEDEEKLGDDQPEDEAKLGDDQPEDEEKLVDDQPEDEAKLDEEKLGDDQPEDEAKLVDDQPEDEAKLVDDQPEAAEVAVDGAAKIENADDAKVQVDINDSAVITDEELREAVVEEGTDLARAEGELANAAPTLDTKSAASEDASEVTLVGKGTEITETLEVNGDNESMKPELDYEDSKTQLENEGSKTQLDSEDPKPWLDEGLRSPPEHVMLDSSAPNNQVSEVSPVLGIQVKSDSISTDSVSINEKIEIKDNIISDNVKLELDIVKPEMVEPSTDNRVPVVGESHPMDVEEPQGKVASVEDKDDSNATNADLSKKNEIVDMGYSEKLNLDRSSGDDSMEEDVESKQIDSKYNSDDVGDKTEKSEMLVEKEELHVVGNVLSNHETEMHVESQTRPSAPSEKRKHNDQEAAGGNEPLKRQRRWNSESLKVPEPQSAVPPTTTPKDIIQPALSRRNFSRSDSTVSNEDGPKERVVPPSQKPPTNSLRIDRFLRPFTIKAVQELLGKTGSVTSFWMDNIKTHCYVSYSSVEQAIETRNAVYNLQWPSNGGRLLVAEFVDPQEVTNKLEAPPSPAAPVTPVASTAPPVPPQPSPRLQVSRQQLPPPPALPPPPPLSNPPPTRERLGNLPPPPPPPPEKHDPPIVTLDDLFRKTRSTPRIYYLPLTEEQVAAKLERAKTTKQ